jgi:hypothetical protein
MFFRKKRFERQLESEIRFHIDSLARDYVAQGMDPSDARRRARLEFGGAAQIKEDLRDVHRPRWLADLRMDLVYAARTLRRSPGFLACAVLTLALGIGANTAIFSLIDAVMLRPMPVREPSRLIQISRLAEGGELGSISYPLFEYFRDRLSSINWAFVETRLQAPITLDGVEELASGGLVSGAYYPALDLKPAAGLLLVRRTMPRLRRSRSLATPTGNAASRSIPRPSAKPSPSIRQCLPSWEWSRRVSPARGASARSTSPLHSPFPNGSVEAALNGGSSGTTIPSL